MSTKEIVELLVLSMKHRTQWSEQMLVEELKGQHGLSGKVARQVIRRVIHRVTEEYRHWLKHRRKRTQMLSGETNAGFDNAIRALEEATW